MKPLFVNGKRVLSASFREENEYLHAAWTVVQVGWYTTRPVYEGATREAAVAAALADLRLTADQVDVRDECEAAR